MATISWEEQQSGADQKDGQMFRYDFSNSRELWLRCDSSHTVMSRRDDYAGSDDAGCAGRGSVLVLKDRQTDSRQCTCQTSAEGMSVVALPSREYREELHGAKLFFCEKEKEDLA